MRRRRALCGGYLGKAAVTAWRSVDTGASGLFAEPLPECGVTDRPGVEPSAVPTVVPAALTTVAVALPVVDTSEPTAPAVLPPALAPEPVSYTHLTLPTN